MLLPSRTADFVPSTCIASAKLFGVAFNFAILISPSQDCEHLSTAYTVRNGTKVLHHYYELAMGPTLRAVIPAYVYYAVPLAAQGAHDMIHRCIWREE